MIKVDLKGTVKEFEAGVSAADVAKSIGMGLYKSACAARVDGEVCDLRTPLDKDCMLEILTFADKDGQHAFWHTAAHIMAQAIQHLYPEAHFGIGPALETGWYYDVGGVKPFTPDQFAAIEAEMKKIAKEDLPIEKRIVSLEEARSLFAGQPYKLELVEEYAEKGWELSVYKQGDFTDLCAGPHLMSTGAVKAARLTQATSAYWRGDSSRDTLCRVYGVAFPKAGELDEYLKQQEEARKRDHNKIGRELEYFTTVDCIGQGLPILLPNGARTVQLLQRWVEDTEQKRGYLLTKTPYMAKRDLYKISGHWDHYRDGMFILGDPDDETKECFALRPMTCPFQYQVFLNRKRSYRDLPMRLGETSTLFRNEDSGEMHGLIRVRQFTISEGHLILRPEQLEEEFRGCLELAKEMLETIGLAEDVSYRFSQWDPNRTDKYEGTAEQWEEAQSLMQKILDHLGLEYEVGVDEAAFYGPKLDIQIKNVFGKEDTLITIQIDMLLAEKFGMHYTDVDGKERIPYIIHRTSIGCYERTLALLLEKYAGALPVWLMPTQVMVIPISEKHHDYAEKVHKALEAAGVRVETDYRSEKMGYKIREAQLKKIPYMLVVGDKEAEEGTVAVRARKEANGGTKSLADFIAQITAEIESKAR
ncbi:MAG TPA: threonine--tRNA ligase [Candidatus Anaerofilum faecale]|nr:threonine--tRNA ligase [Candidatus Anaerofilum faecale]